MFLRVQKTTLPEVSSNLKNSLKPKNIDDPHPSRTITLLFLNMTRVLTFLSRHGDLVLSRKVCSMHSTAHVERTSDRLLVILWAPGEVVAPLEGKRQRARFQ